MANKDALHGRGILVTRPREQAPSLAKLIQEVGGHPILYAAMEIDDPSDLAPAVRIVERLGSYDLAVFVSPTAVQRGLALVRAHGAWPARLESAAVGRASRAALERQGVRAVAPDSGADSEALLALPELSEMRGKRVVIFRGEGGRELLGDTLAARGATVDYAECYRRSPPRADPRPLLKAWASGALHAVTSSSSAGLRHLAQALGETGAGHLRATPLFVSHERIAVAARSLGVREVAVAGAGDDEMVAALVAYFAVS